MMRIKWPTFFLLFLLPFLGLAHGDKTPVVLSGVISTTDGSSVGGAEISIERNGEVIQSTQSKSDGSFELKLDQAYYPTGQLEVRVRKSGYKSESLPAIFCDKHSYEVKLNKAKTSKPLIQRFGPPQAITI